MPPQPRAAPFHQQSTATSTTSTVSPPKPWERRSSSGGGGGPSPTSPQRVLGGNNPTITSRTPGTRRMSSSAQQQQNGGATGGGGAYGGNSQQLTAATGEGSTLNTSSTPSEQDNATTGYNAQSRYGSSSIDRYPYGTYGSRYGSTAGTGMYGGSSYGGGGMYGSRYGGMYGGGGYGSMYGGSMYGGGMYGAGGYGSYGYNRGMMGMMGPEGGIGWLQNVYQLVSSLGQMTELLGMNTEALGYLFGTLMGFLETVGNLVSQVTRPALSLRGNGVEGGEEGEQQQLQFRERSGRVRLLRWMVGLVTTYLAYRLLRKASRWILNGATATATAASRGRSSGSTYHQQLSDAALEQAFMSGQRRSHAGGAFQSL